MGRAASQAKKVVAPYTEFDTLEAEMTPVEDIRADWDLVTCLEAMEEPARVARGLARLGIDTIGDIQARSLAELREAMKELAVPKSDQDAFLLQLRDSSVFPRGIKSILEFRI